MRQDNEDKILEVFYENPGKKFTVRGIVKLTRIPRATVHKKLVELKKEGLVINHKIIERIYREAVLSLRIRSRKKRIMSVRGIATDIGATGCMVRRLYV